MKVVRRMKALGSERGHDLRDEVDLMMRLRIRERMGGRVNEKGKRRVSETEMEVQSKKKERSQKRLKGWWKFSHRVRILLCYRLPGSLYIIQS